MFLPSRMIEPLPKLRSICESAASRAFDLSMDDPSTRRSAALIGRCSLWPGIWGPATNAAAGPQRAMKGVYTICSLFAICSFRRGGYCPNSEPTVLICSADCPNLDLAAYEGSFQSLSEGE